jgi:hypothetical protein
MNLVKNNTPGPRVLNLKSGGQTVVEPGQSINVELADGFADTPAIAAWVKAGDIEISEASDEGEDLNSMSASDRADAIASRHDNPEAVRANLASPATAASPLPASEPDAPRPIEDDDGDASTQRRVRAKK